MIFHNAEIDFAVKSLSRSCGHLITGPVNFELLLIHGRRREKRRLHPLLKPIRHFAIIESHVRERLGFVRSALRFPAAECDYDRLLLT